MTTHIRNDGHMYIFYGFLEYYLEQDVSNNFQCTLRQYIYKIKINFAIYYIFYGIQDNYTEMMAVSIGVKKIKRKKQTTILFLSGCYYGFLITAKVIQFTITSFFTVEASSGWSIANWIRNKIRRDDCTLLIYALFITFTEIVQN